MQEAKKARRGRPMIPVIRITNPFNPREFTREEIAWQRKKTLDAYFPLVESAPVVVSINGKIIPNEQFGVTYLDKTDNVVVCPVPTGGGGGKQILSIVAMIAVSVMAPAAAAAMNGVMGMTTVTAAGALTTAGAALSAGVVVAGSLLVSSIFAPPKPTASYGDTSSTYGVDGAKNTSLEGIPVPVNYGEFRMAGNILGLFTENVADDNQILYMLLSAGEGPIASISNVEINDNPLTDYGTDVEIQTRLGAPNQAVIPWFSKVVVPQSLNTKLSQDWTYHTTTTPVDMLRLDFAAPSGLFKADTDSGKTNTYSVPLEAQYRPADGSGDWASFVPTETVQEYNDISVTKLSDGLGTSWLDEAGQKITDAATLQYLNDNSPSEVLDMFGAQLKFRIPTYVPEMVITAAKRSAVRRSFTSAQLTNQKYEVRTRRTSADSTEDTVVDDVYLTDVNEIVVQEMSYPNTALLALKITLGTKISGAPTVTFMHGGKLIQVYGAQTEGAEPGWYTAASKNPAWVVWDMLTHKRYGGAMPVSRLDFNAFKEWADYCAAQGYEWNGPIDSEMNVWDATQLVLRVGHSQLINVGTRYTIVTEKPADPVMMFSVANMIEGSYKETWLGTQDRANEIDVTYFDKTDKYKQRTLKVYDPAALSAGAKQRTSAITLYGVTDYVTTYKEGQFQLNLNRYILRTAEFSAPLEAVACSVGDLIYVQHDMTEWAVGGRFEQGSTTSVMQLDRPVKMEAGKQYKLLATFDAIQRAAGSVLSVVGTSLFLTGFDADAPVKRIQINGRDLRVAGTFWQGAGYGVILEDTTGIAPGQPYTLWDTDVIEDTNVVNEPGETTVVTLQSPLTSAPVQFANWMFGEVDKVKQKFRVKAVSGTHDYKRDITAIEYKEEVYDFSRYGLNVPTIPTAEGVIGPVRDLSLYEETYVAGGAIVTSIVASWSSSVSGNYAGADVFVKKNDGPLVKVVDAKNVTSAVIDAAKGDVLTVQVQAYDIFGKRSQIELAPTATYTVVGEVSGIAVGGVTGAAYTWSGRDCKINWRYNSVTHSYEFGSEPNGADAGALDPHFKDYEIRVYEADGTTLRRTEYTTDNSYVYIYDKNFADGLNRHLVFEVRMRDIFNNLGDPATLDAYNPPPTITNVASTSTFESATIAYEHSGDPDFAGVLVWLSQTEHDVTEAVAGSACQVYSGPDSAILLPNLMFAADYYYKLAAFDAFGPTELQPTAVLHFKTTNLNVEAIADGVLGDSKLVPELRSRIDLIDAPETGLVDQMAAETQARIDALAAEASTRADAIQAEAATRAQAILGEAAARGAAIDTVNRSIQDTNTSLASTTTTLTASINANAAAIQTETTARTSADSALSSSITSLSAKVDSNTAAITTEQQARADADSALSSSISSLTATVNSNTAAITAEQTARANADSSTAQQLTQLTTDYKAADAATLSSSQSYVQNYAYSKSAIDTSEAAQASSLKTQWQADDTTNLNSAKSYVQSYAYSKSSTDSSIASATSTLRSEYQAGDSTTLSSAQSYVQSYAYSKTTADSSTASTLSTLRSEYQAGDSATLASAATAAQSYVQNYAYSKSSSDSAIATQVNAVSARLNSISGTGVSVEQKFTAQADTNTGLLGQYTVKVDNSGFVTGFGLASTVKNGVPYSEFIINADKFGIVTSSDVAIPFTVGPVDGVTKTIINSALIGDASINSAKIGDAQVNTLKIGANAVTVPSVLQGGATNGIGSGQLLNVGQITLTFPDAVSLVMIATWNALGHGASNTRIEVREGSSVLMAAEDSCMDGYWFSHSTSNKVTVGAGTHTFNIYLGNNWSGTTDVGSWGITFLGVMR